MSSRPLAGFRLNAPQADEEAVDSSNPFGAIGDEIEDPPSEFFVPKPAPVREQAFGSSQQQQPFPQQTQLPTLGPDDPRLSASQNEEGSGRLSRTPLRCLIFVGLLVISLLIGLIVAVTVALVGGGDDSAPTPAPTNSEGQPTPLRPPTLPPVQATPAPVEATPPPAGTEPTSEPKTTLGRIYQRGFLRCRVSDSQPGFAQKNLETGAFEGFDVDMVSFKMTALTLCLYL
jgi:hypothetical protein